MMYSLSMKQLRLVLPAIAITASGTGAWNVQSPCRLDRHNSNHIHRSISLLKATQDDDDEIVKDQIYSGYNVLGTELTCCCSNVGNSGIGTGFYRNGYCSTGDMDLGRHTVCVRVTSDFLAFSKSVGNDLSTPMPQYNFPGLKDGDIWCLCALRWAQAYNAGKAPQVYLQATHQKTLDHIPLEVLMIFAIDGKEATEVIGKLNSQRSQLDGLMNMSGAEDNGDDAPFQ